MINEWLPAAGPVLFPRRLAAVARSCSARAGEQFDETLGVLVGLAP
jgi:HrpA-like RNA helicase